MQFIVVLGSYSKLFDMYRMPNPMSSETLIISLGKDCLLFDRMITHISFLTLLRLGKILEDLDILAGNNYLLNLRND